MLPKKGTREKKGRCDVSSLRQASFLHLLKSVLFLQQHRAHLCTGVRGWIEVNTPLESSTQYLLP